MKNASTCFPGFGVINIADVIAGGSNGTLLSFPHIIGIILAAASLAETGIVLKKFPRNHPLMMNAIGMMVGALILGIVSLISGEAWVIPTQATTWFAFGYIVLFVTVITFFLYLFVLERWTASGTSYGFVLIPLITVVLATSLAGEQISIGYLVGAILVLIGVWFGALLPNKKRANT